MESTNNVAARPFTDVLARLRGVGLRPTRQRLALARLLVSQRPLWLLDEPFAALDVNGQALVAQLMARHCGTGGIIIAATHDPLGLSNESLKL